MDVCCRKRIHHPTIEALNVIKQPPRKMIGGIFRPASNGHREKDAEQEAVARASAPRIHRTTPKTENGGGEKPVVRLGLAGNVQKFQPQNSQHVLVDVDAVFRVGRAGAESKLRRQAVRWGAAVWLRRATKRSSAA